jgi:hypothetical protein
MGKLIKPTDEELLNYLNGTVNPDEAAAINHALATDQEVAQRMEELRSIHRYFLTLTIEEPSKNFTQRVMENLHYTTSHAYSPRNGLMLLIGVMLAVGIALVLLADGMFDATATLDLNQLVVVNKYLDWELPEIPFNGKLIVNLIIIANIALAFIVLDRAVLKPWFERRRNMPVM